MPDWYVYMVRCRDGSLYTGITTDVERRFTEHTGGAGAKYLRGRGPLELVFQKKVGGKSPALSVESLVKKLSKAGKEALINDDTRIVELIEQTGKYM